MNLRYSALILEEIFSDFLKKNNGQLNSKYKTLKVISFIIIARQLLVLLGKNVELNYPRTSNFPGERSR